VEPPPSHRFAAALSPLRRLNPPERGGCIKSNRLSKIQELEDAHTVLPALDGTDQRLPAPHPVGYLLMAQLGPLAAFLQQMPQDLMTR
jgi:hypothetical protein